MDDALDLAVIELTLEKFQDSRAYGKSTYFVDKLINNYY